MPGTVIFLGAGATAACGGLMTKGILPKMLYGQPGADPTGRLAPLRKFVETLFHVSATTDEKSYPGLPLLMSLLDTALDRRQPLHPQWDSAAIANMREAIELGIYDVLEQTRRRHRRTQPGNLLRSSIPRRASHVSSAPITI